MSMISNVRYSSQVCDAQEKVSQCTVGHDGGFFSESAMLLSTDIFLL